MVTRYEVWLDKMSLSAVDPTIYIRDIAYEAPVFALTANDKNGRDGQRVTSRHARNTSVSISFEIHEQDTARRQDVCRKVQAWAARGGMLTTNDRTGQQLRVICDVPPVISSALKWTQALRVTFTAYEQPYWEDAYPRRASVDSENNRGTLYAPGNGALTRVEATVKNGAGSTINALTLKAGGTTFHFEELALASGETLEIGYDEDGLLYIRAGGESKLSCRTAESDDDLMIVTGKMESVSVEAPAGVSVTFKARGLYL